MGANRSEQRCLLFSAPLGGAEGACRAAEQAGGLSVKD